MARLPKPGEDAGTWGDILNNYLSQSHSADGTLKADSITGTQLAAGSVQADALADGAVTNAKLDAMTQAALVKADGALQAASNLADLSSAIVARGNLGLGDVATKDIGTSAGTVAAGDDPRFTNSVARRDAWEDAYASGIFYYGHRNSGATGPDNSSLAARIAIAAGADSLDGDVRLLGDGTPVLMHDPTVDRTTDGTGDVSIYTLQKWQTLRIDAAGLGFTGYPSEAPPTVAEFLSEFGGRIRIHFQLYIPAGGTAADMTVLLSAVDAIVTRLGVDKRMLTLSSNSSVMTGMIHTLGYRSMLVTSDWSAYGVAAVAAGCDEIHLEQAACTAANVAAIHAAGAKVSAWDINTHRARDLAVAAGVDAIMSDNPGYCSGRFPLRTTDLFAAQAYTQSHFRQAGTAGAFIAPNAYGWPTTTSTVDFQTIGYLAPSNGDNCTFNFDLYHASGTAYVWLGKSDDWDNNAESAGRTGCTGYLLSITSAGKVRIEERVNAVRTKWLVYDAAVTGYSVGDATWHSWQLIITTTTIGWKYVSTNQTASYATTAARPIRYVEIGQAVGANRFRTLAFN